MKYWRKPLDTEDIDLPRGQIHIVRNQCKGCGFCVEYCPNDVLKLSDDYNLKGYHAPMIVDEGQCVHCQLCEIICPEFAIFVTEKNQRCGSEIVTDLRKGVEILES